MLMFAVAAAGTMMIGIMPRTSFLSLPFRELGPCRELLCGGLHITVGLTSIPTFIKAPTLGYDNHCWSKLHVEAPRIEQRRADLLAEAEEEAWCWEEGRGGFAAEAEGAPGGGGGGGAACPFSSRPAPHHHTLAQVRRD